MASILGTEGDDFLFDNPFEVDIINAFEGNDTIFLTNDGLDDTVFVEAGDDTMLINDRTGNNQIHGGAGQDTVDYSALGVSITLNAQGIAKSSGGFDFLDSVEVIIGATGAGIVNTIDGSLPPIFGGFNNFDVDLANDSLIVYGLPRGPLSFTVQNFSNVIGTQNDDTIRGDIDTNEFFGGAGNDVLYGGAGDDVLNGDTGNDVLFGDAGDDLLNGGTGRDVLFGGAGNDKLIGGTGDDVLNGNAGDDELFGGTGDDELFGGTGDDVLFGGTGNDVLFGGAGADVLAGVEGTVETDPLTGEFIFDFGPLGSNPGQGEIDELFGSSGPDIFIFGDLASGPFYVGGGNTDYAFIFFDPSVDTMVLDPNTPVIEIPGTLGDREFYWDLNSNGILDSADDLFAVAELPR
ncbi:hemolysin-type calcium-binding repeat (2 copies) [Rubidibacter lacunae KORDI 51-2]|uniref:Hemolysin-type calcium-binding repeat (2 copies) n=1 Tax=Rubidibacter lacunae KORDI 51-2 TaxID=582515 RepID=U5DR76_9CHRO|nr:calcium-binding protein [Rubidibacter lacunae]ERN43099.1 hemolysin-type calcium-binding repeat (2 copies) [Rubidibacter lacunae KORDI 51-2]